MVIVAMDLEDAYSLEGKLYDSVRPIDGSPPGSPIPGILQARILD